MAVKYGKKKRRQNNIFYTIITAIVICAVFLSMAKFFYSQAESESYEMLHLQTKQIKDDLSLQIKSDRENLITMANFASKLYADGEDYSLMFDSFKPIGLFSNIGILNPDNTFVTKAGTLDLNGKISFEEEALRGDYISGRVADLTAGGKEIIRSAVPIKSGDKTVGMLYGVIKLETINKKYNDIVKELDAQLFVFDKSNGNFIIDSIHKNLGNISNLKDRKYADGYSYDELISADNGYSSFRSIYRDEYLYVHFSTLEDINWGIMLARYESQVFEKAHIIMKYMTTLFSLTVLIIVLYLLFVFTLERRAAKITKRASEARKLLLEVNQQTENIIKALENVTNVANSRSSFFIDIEGEDHVFMNEKYKEKRLVGEDKKYLISELFRYAVEFKNANQTSMGVMNIKPDSHLIKTNPAFYEFFKKNGIKQITYAAVAYANNYSNISILGVINPKNSFGARTLLEDIAVCFSIAIYNKNHLNKTYTAATTDALTNVLNRVAYKKDILVFDEETPSMFSCIYIDVNELHLRNNKYGHAAGDEMLIYIANALKGTFFGHKIYRMGGDEFLVFAQDIEPETVKRLLEIFTSQLESVDYHVAIGVSYRSTNTNTEEMVREAEVRMYEAKAQYYQSKEQATTEANPEEKNYIHTKTGILEIDAVMDILKDHYHGIYRVSLETDNVHRILMPSYLGYDEDEKNFSKLLAKYIDDTVHPDFHRAVMSFLNYDAIRRLLLTGKTPEITFKKVNGDTVILRVYKLGENKDVVRDTLWVFAKD